MEQVKAIARKLNLPYGEKPFMAKDILARELYKSACLAQWKRMHPKIEFDLTKAFKDYTAFDSLFIEAQNHYLAMAEYVLNNYIETNFYGKR